MNRRNFFVKFSGFAAALIALPKAMLENHQKVMAERVVNDFYGSVRNMEVWKQEVPRFIAGFNPAYGEDKQLLYIWHPHALPSNLSKINCDNLVIYQFKKDGSVVRV